MGSQVLFHWVWNTISSRKERQFQASATRTLVCISVSFLFRVDGEVRHSVRVCVCARACPCTRSRVCGCMSARVSFLLTNTISHLLPSSIGSTYFQCCLYVNTLSNYVTGGISAAHINTDGEQRERARLTVREFPLLPLFCTEAQVFLNSSTNWCDHGNLTHNSTVPQHMNTVHAFFSTGLLKKIALNDNSYIPQSL